ncbi:cupin domain-containing protein [Rhizobacter sp. AJA081-3]|uniref:cupin domain-containing protein n=1 Tax=Rhizobacter sp. AJA081-3 TaxID=2753607 RepID=UPI001AE03CB9|nr:cupin domain-containing protein [Rhizobacter sp. AJA081-3]QTN21562.1 cupin domain-containing protein [Rhizobacter sp. AJA081-3]
MNAFRIGLLSGLVLATFAASWAQAQQASAPAQQVYVSKPIMVSPVTGDDKKEVVLMSVAIQPSGAVPMHTHPGDCVGAVVEGTVELLVEGQAPRRVAAGEAYNNVRGTVHGFRNVGDTQAKLLNSLVVDKGAPRVQPAAQAAKQ